MAFHVLTAGLSPFPAELSAWFRWFKQSWLQSLTVLLNFLQQRFRTGLTQVTHCDGVLNYFQLSRKNLVHSAHKLLRVVRRVQVRVRA